MSLAVSFTNLGPYHLARLRALARRLLEVAGRDLIVYETAGLEGKYAWTRSGSDEPFRRETLFPEARLETLSPSACRKAMTAALERDRPEAVAAVGYVRPEGLAMRDWAEKQGKARILMSESQEIDHARVWWKERIKFGRVCRFSAGLVGGPRHRDYLAKLGLPTDRVTLGYNAIDHEHFVKAADESAKQSKQVLGLPARRYFIAVNRFVAEKNLLRLIEAYARYHQNVDETSVWDLVLCGAGEQSEELEAKVSELGLVGSVHFPGFLQVDRLPAWLAHASAFVHPSLVEPWGLVVNEAASCSLPLIVSERAGAVETFVPEDGATGRRIEPTSVADISAALTWISALPDVDRRALGSRAREIGAEWGCERFALGTLDALAIAEDFVEKRRNRETVRRPVTSRSSLK